MNSDTPVVESYTDAASLDMLRWLIGKRIESYGAEVEVDEGVGAFAGWLKLSRGWVDVSFDVEVTDFPGFESFEPLLQVTPSMTERDGDPYPLGAEVTGVTRIQEQLIQFHRPTDKVDWSWWRDAGLRFSLSDGRELVFHCPSTRTPEVHMRLGSKVTLPAPVRNTFQSGRLRRFEAYRREVLL
ncbi:hypothetical protein [Corynebacterium yudongzhengii]|uniref:hypothetical protein n=1 Tax=Corynebacterium yudongzhengii TaxID=2080740 RepID=UPI0011B1E4D0|nr:hypothetical protein [Corynebacterium yudongzhengii]